MNRDRAAAILQIVRSLRNAGSWTGRTHIQKTAYLLRELCRIDLGYRSTLYKHGAYSFDLDADVEELRILGGLDYEIERKEYGPRYKEGRSASAFSSEVPKDVLDAIDRITAFVSAKGVKELECLSTLVWCWCENDRSDDLPKLTQCVRQLKPHLSEEETAGAWSELRTFLNSG